MWNDRRTVVSLGIGLLLAVGLWLAVPYNNFVLNNSFISDSYLPEIVLVCLVVLVLVINPLLRRFGPDCVLESRHLAFLTGILLFAAVVPSNGLLRFWPHSLTVATERINESPTLAPAIADSTLPAALFPDRIGHGVATPVASQLVDELAPGAAIPWSAWVVPFLTWGVLFVAFWVLLVGMGLMVFPQWVGVERLAFPLLRVYHAILDVPVERPVLPPLFRSIPFWVSCGVVLAIHSSVGLAMFTDGAVPSFPVTWDIRDMFTEGVWRFMPGVLTQGRIYFVFVGLAFFMPNRYSFSIWFTVLLFGFFLMYTAIYRPFFDAGRLYDQACGALLAMAAGIIWLGRKHYWRVLRAAFGREQEDNAALAGRLFLVGGVVMLGWFVWAGVGWWWAMLFVATAVIIMLVVARIVAETGLTYVWIIALTSERLSSLFPARWQSVATAFLQEAHYILANRASAVSAATMAMLALGMDRAAHPPAQRRVALAGIVVLVLGFLVCGAVHLDMGYHWASSLDGLNRPITGRGTEMITLEPVVKIIAGRDAGFPVEKGLTILWGVFLGAVLLVLCGRFPWWPLHPMGLIFVYSSIGFRLFMSLFLGWLVKTLLIRLGGARAYRVAQPVFLGLIFGEIFANALWTLVPVVQLLLGADPSTIRHMAIFQYT